MHDSDEAKSTGGCQCGAVRYVVEGQPIEIYVCHCNECRAQSASAFGISVIVPNDKLHLTQGNLSKWSRPTDSGGTLDCFFCPQCGTRVWHGNPVTDLRISVKGGSLDQPPDISEVPHIWVFQKLDGVLIPQGVPTWPGEPNE